ncbi:HDIG domain-containing protein [bacterium]|nr:HDIG domain-containing protein [bacterium]
MALSEDIRKLFPELELIGDRTLREQTLDVWTEAAERGGWTAKDLTEIPFTLLIETGDISLIDHTRAVTKTSIAIATVLTAEYGDELPIDRDHLISGGLLHDVGKCLEYERKGKNIVKSEGGKDLRHPFSGTALAFQRGLPSDICHMIAVHAGEGTGHRHTTEAFIIHHADFVNFEPLRNKAQGK